MQAHRIDSRAIYRLSRGADAKEGIASFLEKRAPDFPGRPSSDMPDFYPWWEDPDFDAATAADGAVAALRCRTGVAKVLGVKVSGFWAWWIYRTVYLMKMPGVGRKLRLVLDWTIELFFKSDIVQIGVHRDGPH